MQQSNPFLAQQPPAHQSLLKRDYLFKLLTEGRMLETEMCVEIGRSWSATLWMVEAIVNWSRRLGRWEAESAKQNISRRTCCD